MIHLETNTKNNSQMLTDIMRLVKKFSDFQAFIYEKSNWQQEDYCYFVIWTKIYYPTLLFRLGQTDPISFF